MDWFEYTDLQGISKGKIIINLITVQFLRIKTIARNGKEKKKTDLKRKYNTSQKLTEKINIAKIATFFVE